ncbi:phage tail fiber assembly protein, partial [Rahnella aquatilis CIP 78.65 = ATCC 33071]|uniref:tail fiber assembly protein n=1 Tax=Rahnella aquatilis TaxID=34038 RepID=UPI0004E2AACA
ENYYYSAKNNGIYPLELKAAYEDSVNGWPDDAKAISNEEYVALFEGQASGKIITAGKNGYPVLSEPPAQTQAQLIMEAEVVLDSLLNEAKDKIIVWQTKLAIGRVLMEGEKIKLNAWLDYIDALEEVDTGTAPDIEWPEIPA